MSKSYVPYYRVSTKQQGHSGLGLESQVSAVERTTYVRTTGHYLLRTKRSSPAVTTVKPHFGESDEARPLCPGNACHRETGPPE